MRSVRDERWKLIVYPPIDHRAFFVLKDDPDETRNLAADPNRAAEVERLTARMKGWHKKVGDTQPLTVEKLRPKDVSFDGFDRKPDKWQPPWIVEKYVKKP